VLLELFLLALWTIGCGVGIGRLYRLHKSGKYYAEHSKYGGAVALLLMAPYTSLLVYYFTPIEHLWTGAGQLLGALVLWAVGLRSRSQRMNPDSERFSQTSFREKSAILMFATLVVLTLSGLTFVATYGLSTLAPVILAAVAMLITIAIVGHLAIAVLQNPIDELDSAADERDREVELGSIRNAYYVLGFGIWSIPVIAVIDLSGLIVALVACSLILAAELVYYGSLVRYYRTGVA